MISGKQDLHLIYNLICEHVGLHSWLRGFRKKTKIKREQDEKELWMDERNGEKLGVLNTCACLIPILLPPNPEPCCKTSLGLCFLICKGRTR